MDQTLQQDKLEDVDFKYENIFFQIPAQKYPNKAFLVPNLGFFFFFFCEILQLDKFESADLKCVNIVLKIQSKNT